MQGGLGKVLRPPPNGRSSTTRVQPSLLPRGAISPRQGGSDVGWDLGAFSRCRVGRYRPGFVLALVGPMLRAGPDFIPEASRRRIVQMSCVSALARTLRPMTEPRRLVILTEGQFGAHHAKTAMGVIRYATDRTVAVLDSSIAGRNVSEWLPGHDIPAVATLDAALALPEPPDTLLIGIAPTGGKLPPEWRTHDPRGDRSGPRGPFRAAHVPRRRPRVLRGCRREGRSDRRLPAAAGAPRDRRRPTPRCRQAGDPDGRHRLRDRQDVGRAGAAGSRGSRPATRLCSCRPARPG